MQQIARANLIFGLHVHVGIPDREEGIDMMNQARYFLPHLYALSVNSPFWLGQNTGLKAYRQMIFERSRAPGFPMHSRAYPNMKIIWRCLSRPTVSIMRKRFGGTSGSIRFSIPSSSGFVMRNRASMTPSRWQR